MAVFFSYAQLSTISYISPFFPALPILPIFPALPILPNLSGKISFIPSLYEGYTYPLGRAKD